MEVFIAHVAFHATQHDVTRAIASKLHVPEYTVSMPLNFHVRLFKDKSNQRLHSGCGTVTLPTADIGKRFLARYGEHGRDSITVKNRRLVLKPSDRTASTDILTSVQNSPYLDPKVREQREHKAQTMNQTSAAIKQIQFCWECRDYFVSIEWERYCPGAGISFSTDKPRMIIAIPSSAEHIMVEFSQINYLSTHSSSSDGAVIYISLANPPVYLINQAVATTDSSVQKRRSSLGLTDDEGRPHEEVAPYTSMSLRLICNSKDDITALYHLIKLSEANFYVDEEYYDVVRRRLFSRKALETFFSWLRTVPFSIAHLFESLIRDRNLDPCEILEPELQSEIRRLIRDKTTRGEDYMRSVIQDFGRQASVLYWNPDKPKTLLQCFKAVRHQHDRFSTLGSLSLIPSHDDDIFMCLHVLITPTSIFLEGPLPERTNRVIRSFSRKNWPNFIRVSFVDEGKLKMQYDRDVDGPNFVQYRVGPILLNGLEIAGRSFRFLAYSQSALKEHTVWFLRSFKHKGVVVDVPTVINSLGSFAGLPFDSRLMYCPARYAARISQGFTTTDPTTVEVESIQEISDIKTIDPATGTKWTHTDGVGTMSSDFARSIHLERQQKKRGRRFRPNDFPRALQIRFMGSKGMLSVDYRLPNKTVCLRPSMVKFTGTNAKTIEIAKVFDKPGHLYLNRPLIMLLEGLGVPYQTFKKYQDAAVRDVYESTQSFERAARFMEGHGLGSSFRLPGVFHNLHKLQTPLPEDRFFDKMMEYTENHVLRELKHKARIPVPGAYNLVGVADIHRYLKPRQIFVCIKPIDGSRIYLSGPVLVSRSPAIHPGDVQLVTAIGAPPPGSPFEEESLPNTIVFSTTDSRPLPSCLGGGDLDGDEYNVIPLDDLPEFAVPASKIAKPSQYTPAKRKELPHPCQHEDIARFVMDYITSDVLGYIAITWRIIADQKPEGIFHPDCLRLSDLHSTAVDYPKTGQPVPMNAIPKRPTERLPDWHAPETANTINPDRYYPSQRAIGKLFREIDLPATDTVVGMGRAQRRRFYQEQDVIEDMDDLAESLSELSFDTDLESDPVYYLVKRRVEEFASVDWLEPEISWMISELFMGYRSYLQTICSTHTLVNSRTAMLTEEEAIVGTIVANTSQPRKRQDHIAKLREQTDLLVRGVRENIYGNENNTREDRLRVAFFAFKFAFTLKFREKGSKFGARSFEWIALGAVFESIREIEEAVLEEKRQYERQRRYYDRRRY